MLSSVRLAQINKIFLVAVTALCVVSIGAASAEDTKKTAVPYPEAWCRMPPLSGDSFDLPFRLSAVYLDAQNHPVIAYAHDFLKNGGRKKSGRVVYQDFFTGEIFDTGRVVGDQDKQATEKPHGGGEVKSTSQGIHVRLGLQKLKRMFDLTETSWGKELDPQGNKVLFDKMKLADDGHLLRTSSRDHGLFPISYGLRKVDANGRTEFDVMLMLSTRYRLKRRNPYPANEFWEGHKFSNLHNHAINPEVYELADGTFLLMSDQWPGVVRFDSTMKSPCLDQVALDPKTDTPVSKLLVVDGPWLRKTYKEALALGRKERGKSSKKHPLYFADDYITRTLRNAPKLQR